MDGNDFKCSLSPHGTANVCIYIAPFSKKWIINIKIMVWQAQTHPQVMETQSTVRSLIS